MATSIGQYASVFLPGEPLSLTEKPGRPQTTGMQRVGHDWSDSVRIDAKLFLPVAALPLWKLSVKVVQLSGTLAAKCAGTWMASTARVMALSTVFFQAFCSWWSEALFAQSFSVALPVRALRGLPCLGSFSVVRHTKGPPWLGSYSVDRGSRHLKHPPGWGPTL